MAPPQSPDLEIRFAVFLNPIRDLTKNWEVDIAKYLEEYLEELAEIRITFDGGDTTMNFAEAAMLIQGSATVYSKKVEFLWQMVLQMLDLLSTKRSTGANDGETTGRESTKGKHNHEIDSAFSRIDNVNEGRNIDIKDDDDNDDIDDVRNAFKFLPTTPLHLVEKESEKSHYRINIYLKNDELLGAKDDYRINRSYITPNGMLCLDIPSGNVQEDNIQGTFALAMENIPEEVEADQLPLPIQTDDLVQQNDDDDDDGFVHDDIPIDAPDEPENVPPSSEENGDGNVEAMEVESEQTKNQNNQDGSDIIEFPARYGLRKRFEKENTMVIKLKEPWKPCDPHADTTAKRPIRAGRIRKPLPCQCHKVVTPSARSRRKKLDEEKAKTLPQVENFVSSALTTCLNNHPSMNLKMKKISSLMVEEAMKEETKRLSLGKQKKVKDLINEGKAASHGEAIEKVNEQDNQDLMEHNMDDINEDVMPGDDDDVLDTMAIPDPHTGHIEHEYGQRPRLHDSLMHEAENEYEGLVQKLVNEYIANAQEHIVSSDLAIRVSKWRENITPKLEEEEKRTAFDIHSYGSNILSHFPNGVDSPEIAFAKVVENCETKEVSRYFLSSLMLANTYNVELLQTEEGDLEMDCLNLKFLSNVRHHEALQEYAAPSQEVGNPTRLKPKNKKKKRQSLNRDDNDDGDDVNHNHRTSRCSSSRSPPPSPTSSVCSDITHRTNSNQENIQKKNNNRKNKKVKSMSKR